ncbi:MAG TPA: aldolase/citrate lyase family protein [Atribacterota bacterium]|nr:aldolase/citrate lyase family protein [Atribacterota bacterium]
MIENRMKRKIEKGIPVVGTFFGLNSTLAVECLGLAGLDFLVIDCEHGPADVESTINFVLAAEFRGITPLVRVKNQNRDSILKMLDIGAKGLVIPCLETIDEVRNIVKYGKYYPIGQRGVAMSRSGGFGFEDFSSGGLEKYFEICNKETLLIPQCETIGFLDNIEVICAIDGIDGIFIGPFDLSVALKKPGKFDDKEFLSALRRVKRVAQDAGKFVFIHTSTTQEAREHLKNGFDGVTLNQDVVMLTRAYQDEVNEIRS